MPLNKETKQIYSILRPVALNYFVVKLNFAYQRYMFSKAKFHDYIAMGLNSSSLLKLFTDTSEINDILNLINKYISNFFLNDFYRVSIAYIVSSENTSLTAWGMSDLYQW